MANVVEKQNLATRLLDYLENRCQDVEEMNQQWDHLSADDKNDFLIEWPIVEDKLTRLENMAEQHEISGAQFERYSKLKKRIALDRPILESLWNRP